VKTFLFITLFCKNYFTRKAHFCSKFKNKLRTIPASVEEQSLRFSIKVVN